jgi:Calcium binding
LMQLEATTDASEATKEAISDWHYWVSQGYEFG